MTKTKKIILSVLIAVAAVTAIALNSTHKNQESSKKMNTVHPSNIELALYQQGSDFEKKYPKTIIAETQNVGLNFYNSVDFDANALPTITINAGGVKTIIPKALSIMGVENKTRGLGITRINIHARVKNGGAMPHDEARLYILDIIEKLTAAGWKMVIPLNKPRLNGIHALNYYGADALDPNYKLSFAEWMQLKGILSWELYLNHTFITLNINRDQDHLDPNKPGAYIMSFTIEPHEEVQRIYVEEKERDHWRQLWIPIARKLRSERNIKEATLKAQGIPIVSDYKDPELPPPPPGQQNPVIPKDLQ